MNRFYSDRDIWRRSPKLFSPNLIKRGTSVVCFIFIILQSLFGTQDYRIVFSHLDVNDGLSENWIKCVYRDSKGFVWFGTNSGLNRFDGYKIEIFRKSLSDSNTVSDNSINVITEDKEGNLWIGTGNGINILNGETYNFRRLNLQPSVPLLCQDIAYITAMAADPDGNILTGTHNGLFFFNQQNNSFRHILIDEQSCSSQMNNISAITHDKAGSFWIGTANGFVIKYNISSNSFEKFESLRQSNERQGSISSLFADDRNNLWIADQNGLHLFTVGDNSWNLDFQKRYSEVFRRLQFTGIDQDIDGQIWLTTDGKGVFIIDPENFRIINITNLPYSLGALSSDGISSLFCDESGIVWLGTAKKGVDFYKKNVRKFRLLRNYPTDNNSLSNNDVDCITEDYKGNIWIGTNGGGLNYYDRKTQSFRHYFSNPDKANSLSSNIIVSLYEDSDRKIWIGTYFGGLNCLDPKTGEITVYRHNVDDSTSLSDDRVWGICEDSNKNLWIATLTNGINLFDRKTGKFKRFNAQNSPICFNFINSIALDENDNLWLSSANGLIFYDPKQNRAKCYYSNTISTTSLSDNHIVSTFKDSRGLFWICTNNGLNLMEQESDEFRVFREEDGLPSNSVLRILEDNDSNLWISTRNGISRLIITRMNLTDSLTFRFANYGMSDGLQGKEFNETAAWATRDGELWFGGTDGLNAFYPSEIIEDTAATKLFFTGFRIFNKTVKHGEEINNRILLEKPVFNTDRIVLKYKENSFTLDFVALNFFYPEKNKYAYNLEGFNDKWIETDGKENFATFSNLNNGNYTFRLKGTNSDGIWNKDFVTLRIRVLPPFWKSWYAYIIYFLLISSLLSLLRYLTLSRERLKSRMEQEVIESQHIHEIDALKIRFFTNISHEFRTPLTLILSPVEKLLYQWKDRPEEKYLNLIKQNAKRLLLMVNQLLDFRKMEVQGFGLNPAFDDIISFIKEAVASFNDLSEQKHIGLFFYSEIKELNTWFDKDKLEKILFNLLSNAFKFTPEKGRVSVIIFPGTKISSPDMNGDAERISHLRIKVEDTGIGIPADKIDKLFTKYYQLDTSVSGEQGSGIGLSLVKEFVKLLEGDIYVESESGKGTCFTIIIPVSNDENLYETGKPGNGEAAGIPVIPLPAKQGYGKSDTYKSKPTLLIAEDNDDLRFYIKDNFKNHYDVYEAANGGEALAIIRKIVPDLVISDIVMPGIDGIELCRIVKTDRSTCHIPFVLLTARSNVQDQFEGFETGADDFITKPFNFQILEAKINNLINLRKSLRQVLYNNLRIEPHDITITSLDEKFIQKALDLVEKNMSKPDYTVEELSRDLGISRTLLYKKILTLTGKPPLEFIRTLRLKRAAQLLQKSQLNVSEIAFRVGFNDPKYFRKHFKSEFGVLPSRYAEKFK